MVFDCVRRYHHALRHVCEERMSELKGAAQNFTGGKLN